MKVLLLIFLGLIGLVIVAIIWGDILASLKDSQKKLEDRKDERDN